MKSRASLAVFAISIITLTVGLSGCDGPQPMASIPNVILYSIQNQTRVFVTGDDYMYESINITINNETEMENFTYGFTSGTSSDDIKLEVRVVDNQSNEDREKFVNYTYSALIMVEVKDDEINFILTDTNHDDEIERKSPYKTLMEKE